MKVAGIIKRIYQKRNRIVSGATQAYRRWILRAKILGVRVLAAILNHIDARSVASIPETVLPDFGPEQGLTVNCLGAVDVTGAESYQRDIASISDRLREAQLSFALVSDPCADDSLGAMQSSDVTLLQTKTRIGSCLYRTAAGTLAIITYDRSQTCGSENEDKLQIMRHFLALKQKNADYVIVYINNHPGDGAQDKSGSRLCKVIAQMGADYIVGVLPDRRDSGSTYLKPGGVIARSVYSLGVFSSDRPDASPKRVLLRLKLRAFQGKLQLVEETYFPYYHTDKAGMVSLLDPVDGTLSPAQIAKYRAEIEDEMRRIRPADRVLTVGQVMQLIGAELPDRLLHLRDFSVGKICARSSEVMAGDLFFFREPYTDPNDQQTSPKRRLNIARTAAKKGAILLITFQPLPFPCAAVLCGNVMEAHVAVCAHLRKQYGMKTIAITGSIGKTSTKDMLAEVMRMRYNTVKSERNSNVQVAIGMNLQKLNDYCEVFIQEIGGGRPGGASRHSRMVLPEVAVVTNIGDAHIGNFSSKEKLMESKLQIVDGMTDDGILFLNGDDPMLANVRTSHKTVYYAVYSRNADYYVENLSTRGGFCTFEIVHNGTRTPVTLRVLGEYNVINAVCCFAIGKQFGIPEEDIAIGLSHFQTTGIRQNLMEVCGRKLFLDCYNASTESVKSAMEILTQIQIEPGKKRIAVVGDITGTGALSEEIHREIGETIQHYPVDHILLFGEDVKFTYEILRETSLNVRFFSKREELNETLLKLVDVGDVVMFKGSSKMLLEYTVDMIYGTRLTDQRLKDEREYKYARQGSVVYDLYANHATAEVYDPLRSGERRVQIASRVGGIEVVNMGRALSGRNIAQVLLPDSIRHISAEAFMGCAQLTMLRLPKKLKYIGNDAFKNCRSLQEISIPEQVMHIGSRAFYGCSGLRKIYIPSSVVQIGKDAFYGCENCRFVCQKGSYAERYLQEAGLNPQVQ